MALRWLLALVPVLVLAMVFSSHVVAQSDPPSGQITAAPRSGDDHAIEVRIEGIFSELEGLESISVSVKSGVVDLAGTVTESVLAKRAEALAGRVAGVVAVQNSIVEETALEERLVPVYERLQSRVFQGISYLPLLVVAVLVLMFAGFTGFLIARLEWPWNRLAPNAFVADLLRQLIRIFFLISGVVLALDVLGATAVIGTLLGAAGIVGLAVGFAVRDTVENYIASIMLSIRQPFSPKDFVRIEGHEGFVISLTSRATILMEADGNHIRIPNAIVFKSTIINYSTNPQRRFVFELGVDSDSDLDEALEVGLETVRGQDFVLREPSPDAWINKLGDSNVVLTFAGWIDQNRTDFLRARSEAMRLVKGALEDRGFSLPEPIYRLRFDGGALDALNRGSEPRKKPVRTAGKKPAVKANDTEADRELEKRVDEERKAAHVGDLLDDEAPKEFGAAGEPR
ncbi:MAG: mechanosensitive ion channel family protein [Roseibium sp.]